MGHMKTVSMLINKGKELKIAYDQAVKRGDVKFEFDGGTYYTVYAKHVLDYIEMYNKKINKNGQ